MRKLKIIIPILLFCVYAKSQIGAPSWLPNPSSNGYAKWGYLRQDSGLIMMPRDTFKAKYPTIILHTNGKYYRTEGNSTKWRIFGDDWSLTGNTGTVAGTNFIGTKDAVDWVIKTNDIERARVTSLGTATFVKDVLVNNITVGKGGGSLFSNTAIGGVVLSSNTIGLFNTGVGEQALAYNTTGGNNTAIGYNSLYSNITGSANTAVGQSSLLSNIDGFGNTSIGFSTLYNNISGIRNVAIGYGAVISNTTGRNNIGIGDGALSGNNIGQFNIAIGADAGFSNSSGKSNIYIGNSSGFFISAGDSNVNIGYFNKAQPSARSKFVIINDGAANLAYQKDSVGNITIPIQTINNDTTNNKIVVQNTTTGRLRLSNWNASSSWLTGDIKEIDVSNAYIAANFDGTGLGINERTGWAICNGNNGTKNRNGRVSIGYGTSYLVMGATGGSETHTLTANELPTIAANLGIVQITGDNTFTVGDMSPGEYDLKTAAPWPGAGAAHNIMQPYIVTLFIQKL